MSARFFARRLIALAALAFAAGAPAADAQSPAPAAPPTFAPYTPPPKNPNSYDDPGMHFQPPDEWKRLPVNAPPDGQFGTDPAIVAAYVKNREKPDQRLISISVQAFSGTLEGFEKSHETDLRNAVDSTFVDKKQQTTLHNGMPAYFVKVSQGNEAGQFARRFEWIVFDGERGIVVAYAGRSGDFDDKEATSALDSLYVVAYPRRRR